MSIDNIAKDGDFIARCTSVAELTEGSPDDWELDDQVLRDFDVPSIDTNSSTRVVFLGVNSTALNVSVLEYGQPRIDYLPAESPNDSQGTDVWDRSSSIANRGQREKGRDRRKMKHCKNE